MNTTQQIASPFTERSASCHVVYSTVHKALDYSYTESSPEENAQAGSSTAFSLWLKKCFWTCLLQTPAAFDRHCAEQPKALVPSSPRPQWKGFLYIFTRKEDVRNNCLLWIKHSLHVGERKSKEKDAFWKTLMYMRTRSESTTMWSNCVCVWVGVCVCVCVVLVLLLLWGPESVHWVTLWGLDFLMGTKIKST